MQTIEKGKLVTVNINEKDLIIKNGVGMVTDIYSKELKALTGYFCEVVMLESHQIINCVRSEVELYGGLDDA